MALFDWPAPTTCGEASPEPCDAIDGLESLKALRGTDPDTLCERELVAPEHPAIPVVIGDNLTEARSGSGAYPIPLGLVQAYTGAGPVPTLGFRNAAGDFSFWSPPIDCFDKRMVVGAGGFQLIEDQNSNVYDESCIGDIADVTYVAGGVPFVNCDGDTKVKLVFFPKTQFCDICS